MLSKKNHGVTLDMLRAFVELSDTLNLSQASDNLSAARQTVRRHINDLESLLGGALFDVSNRHYRLTAFGSLCLPEAKSLLTQVDSWSGRSLLNRKINAGLESLRYADDDGRIFLSQQHSIAEIAVDGLPLMRQSLRSWGTSLTQIEDAAMSPVLPYLVHFRRGSSGWYFVHVGEKSAYARWFGWRWSKSCIGKLISQDHLSDEYNEFSLGAYDRIYEEGGVRFDHVLAHLPQAQGEIAAGTFQRLLLSAVFPDGTPGLILMSVISEDVRIDQMDKDLKPSLSPEMKMDAIGQDWFDQRML